MDGSMVFVFGRFLITDAVTFRDVGVAGCLSTVAANLVPLDFTLSFSRVGHGSFVFSLVRGHEVFFVSLSSRYRRVFQFYG